MIFKDLSYSMFLILQAHYAFHAPSEGILSFIIIIYFKPPSKDTHVGHSLKSLQSNPPRVTENPLTFYVHISLRFHALLVKL